MWYYTSEGRQMEPVPLDELRQLVRAGGLKPTDMVWKEGMPRWVRASSAQEVYGDAGVALTGGAKPVVLARTGIESGRPSPRPAKAAKAEPVPKRSVRTPPSEEELRRRQAARSGAKFA